MVGQGAGEAVIRRRRRAQITQFPECRRLRAPHDTPFPAPPVEPCMRCCRTRLTDALQQRIRLLPTRLIGPGGNDDSVEGTFTAIAVSLGRTVSTVSREVKANGGRDAYRAHVAHQRAFEQSRRPKTPKLACERLAAKVAEWLEEWWSP